jgi:hypothetical protein
MNACALSDARALVDALFEADRDRVTGLLAERLSNVPP